MSAKNLDQKGRHRNKIVAFRVSPEEDALIERAVHLSGLTKQDFIIKRLQNKDIVVQGNPKVFKALKEELKGVMQELQRIDSGVGVDSDLLDTIRLIAITLEGMKIDSSHYYCFGCGAHAGIVALMPLYKGVHMLADIGNGTMNTLVITNGRAMSDRMYTDKLGVHQCVKRIYNAVQAECGKLPDESLIEDFLRNGTVDTSNRILSVMQTEAEKYTVEIFDKLSEYEYDPEMVKLHIIGGGGCLIRNFGTYDTDSVEIISDICATAKGYESLYMTQVRMRKGA